MHASHEALALASRVSEVEVLKWHNVGERAGELRAQLPLFLVSGNFFPTNCLMFCSFRPFYSSAMLSRKFCLELVGSDGGLGTICFPAVDVILEVTREDLVIRCSKCANNVSCCGCGGPAKLSGVHGY